MKTSNIYSSILIGLLIVFSISCKKNEEVTSTTDNPTTSNTDLPKNVKIINDQTWNNNIITLDSVYKTVTFSKNITSNLTIQAGDILVSSVGEGFLRKAKTLTSTNNTIQVQTEPAYLTEVIKEGIITFNQVLSVQKIKSIQMHYDGIKLITSNNKSSTSFPLEINTVLFDADGNNSTTSDQIRLSGSFNCDWKITGLIDVGFIAGLKEVKFGFESNENVDLQLLAGLQYNFAKTYNLATVYFAPIIVWVPLTVPVPVVFTPQFDIIVGTSGFANASLTSQIGQSMSFNAGVQWLKASGWTPFQTFTKTLTFQPPQLNVNASAEVFIKPEMTLKVYSVAGPYVNSKVYGRLDADILQTPWWKLYGGATMNAGAKVNVIDMFLLEFTVSDIIKYETLLAQSSLPPVSLATVTTNNITAVTQSTAKGGGNISTNGGANITERGLVYATKQNPTISDKKVESGVGSGNFSAEFSGLTPNTTYYVRAYAVNSQGPAYGNQVSFTTSQMSSLAIVSTSDASVISANGAIVGGNVSSDGFATVTERGIAYATSQNPTIDNYVVLSGAGLGIFTSNLVGLTPNTTYYVRAYAKNSQGTAYGNQINFTTMQYSLATVMTNPATIITTTGATLGGTVTGDGNSFIIERGIVYAITQNPTISNNKVPNGTGLGSYSSNLINLIPNSTYYVRAYATNSTGTAYGIQVSLTTASPIINGTVTDIDGNTYSTVTIGTQVWMGENLRVTKLNDNTEIPQVINYWSWGILHAPGYCLYDDSQTNKNTYGVLYNGYAVETRKLCPNNWHVATDSDWTTLTNSLGGGSIAGGKLKEKGIVHWVNPNVGATNETGFTALPGGYRSIISSTYSFIGKNGFWWTSSGINNSSLSNYAWVMYFDSAKAFRNSNYSWTEGLSVRCVKD